MIRAFEEGDILAVAKFNLDAAPSDLTAFLQRPAFAALVHEDDGQVTGYIMGWSIGGEGEVIQITVAPPYRRQKIGQQLLTAFCQEFAASRCNLDVRADNLGALALYHGAGFTEYGRRTNYYKQDDGEAIDAILMRRTLT